ncbi:Tetratricopeptide repeat protein [anaerobic digester metagenome]|jgi:tetratricopeptide (TPR) repeat protein|uniref:tetratricopeptide repeat protein n=1 Tax=Petrimonas sp. TaxID=2023866 RepID=UPI0030CE990C
MKKILIILFLISIVILNTNGQGNNVQTLIHEGVALHDSAEYKKAIEKFEQALKINPKSTLALYEISLSYLELKDYENASKYSTRVINSNDKNLSIGAYAVKSEAMAEMKQIDNAIAILQEGLIKNGDSYLLHFNMALNYYKKGDIDKTLEHVSRAIELDKTNSGAFLLNAYAQRDKGLWVRSIYSFQLFLLLEPDSKRSKNAFEEMLQTMLVKPVTEKPVERSFIQQQLLRNMPENSVQQEMPPLSTEEGLNRKIIYNAIKFSMDSLKAAKKDTDVYFVFTEVNKAILSALEKESGALKSGSFWTFHYPFFKSILNSNHYDTFCRYISVSYFPESLEWWENNKTDAENFINWFENGEDNGKN